MLSVSVLLYRSSTVIGPPNAIDEQASLLDDLLDLSELPDVGEAESVHSAGSPPPPPPADEGERIADELQQQGQHHHVQGEDREPQEEQFSPSAEHVPISPLARLERTLHELRQRHGDYLVSVLTFRQQGEDAQTTVLSTKMRQVLDLGALLRTSSTILRDLIAESKGVLGQQGELKLTCGSDAGRDLYCQALELLIENAQLRLDANHAMAESTPAPAARSTTGGATVSATLSPVTRVPSSASSISSASSRSAAVRTSSRDSWFTSWF
jgi:hypothetical protein